MKIANFDTKVIPAAGDLLFTSDQTNAALKAGLQQMCINPSVAIVLVDETDGGWGQVIPGSVAGTAANSPFTCAANTPTMVAVGGGNVKAISTGADSTVKRAFSMVP